MEKIQIAFKNCCADKKGSAFAMKHGTVPYCTVNNTNTNGTQRNVRASLLCRSFFMLGRERPTDSVAALIDYLFLFVCAPHRLAS